jgi:biotin transporter BioY
MTTLAPTLSNRFLPHTAGWLRDMILILIGDVIKLRDMILILLSALFVAALAQIEIPLPFTPVPLTGQTLGVLLAERGLERSVRTSLIPFLVGTGIIYVCGVAWLTVFLGSLGKALAAGLFSFLIGDVIKLAASLASTAAWRFVR